MTGQNRHHHLNTYHIPGHAEDDVVRILDDALLEASADVDTPLLRGEVIVQHADIIALDQHLDAVRRETLEAA